MERHKSAGKRNSARAASDRYSPDDESTEGCDARRKYKAARDLTRAGGGENSHKAASEGKSSNVVARLVIWIKVDRIAAETNNSMVWVELRPQQTLNQQYDPNMDTNSTKQSVNEIARLRWR